MYTRSLRKQKPGPLLWRTGCRGLRTRAYLSSAPVGFPECFLWCCLSFFAPPNPVGEVSGQEKHPCESPVHFLFVSGIESGSYQPMAPTLSCLLLCLWKDGPFFLHHFCPTISFLPPPTVFLADKMLYELLILVLWQAPALSFPNPYPGLVIYICLCYFFKGQEATNAHICISSS